MFVDYSGLQRFSDINRGFGRSYLKLLRYDSTNDTASKLENLQKEAEKFQSVKKLEVENFENQSGVLDFLFKVAVSVTQMIDSFDSIKRCPTLYVIKIIDEGDIETNGIDDEAVKKATCELLASYKTKRKSLFEEIKKLIIDLRPSDDLEGFEQWHVLQKCLFYETCPNISKFSIPKIDIIIIPVNFPTEYESRVDSNGFITEGIKLEFSKFHIDGYLSGSDIHGEQFVLRRINDKISTIWRGDESNEFISTSQKSDFKDNENAANNSKTDNEFECLFRALFPEMGNIRITPKKIVSGQCNKSINKIKPEKTNQSTNLTELDSADVSSKNDGSLYDIFSPLSSNNLPTALTPVNNNEGKSNFGAKSDFIIESSRFDPQSGPLIMPPPPSLLSPYQDSGLIWTENDTHSLKDKLKKLLVRPRINNITTYGNSRPSFDTIGSFSEFQTETWNSMTSRKFLKFKYKKFKRSCRYYRDVAKQCFEDIQGVTTYQ